MISQKFEPESFVSNFLSADKIELVKFSKENGFSFSEDLLVYIQEHYRNKKKVLPTYNQLDFFNKINELILREKRNCAIGSVFAKDAEASIIFDTAKDLLAKKNLCQKKLLGPTPINYVAQTASEYLRYIDCSESASYFLPAEQASYSNYYVHLSDKKPLFSLIDTSKSTKKSKSEKKIAIAMLSPIEECSYDEYTKSANNFFSAPDVKSHISNYKTVSNYLGLLKLLSTETDGIFVDLSKLSDVKKDENGIVTTLDPLLFACHGRCVFDITPEDLPTLRSISEKHGLSVTIFATRNDSELFILDKTYNPAFCFKFDFIQSLMNIQSANPYSFTKEADLGPKIPVFLSDKKDGSIKSYYANNFLAFTQTVASASARELKDSPYKTAAITALDAIGTLIAKGTPKSAIKLSIHYTLLSETNNEIELGKNFAAILGAYRTMIELCVSDSNPQISYSVNKRDITVLASARKQIRRTKNSFDNEESFVYFLPVFYDELGIPDYKKYRETIKFFYSLLEKDSISSSFYVNENITSVISSAASKSSIVYSDFFNAEEFKLSRGILFETKEEILAENLVIFIGKNLPSLPSDQ